MQIQGLPDWTANTHVDIEAKTETIATEDRVRLMLQRLLADRFNLRAHRETRDMSRYALVKARSDGRLGERLRPSAFDCPAIIAARGRGKTSLCFAKTL